ncbi:MAG: cell division protein FtsL [Armatimonadota bacterium]|nr:cell division protein FtsL [Armatimonadota bacterium]MDR7451744.1 cell division protein FtsL [Armatimonadota bacterium]MDR7467369.1 cell division protein FtsL [Armatimonadota bacterium]MDR7494139.1 cell division protein FtsL [Armatimonadota bacterium]MDR7498895.1 cell division protein FtsL [Armatimonadota bacterium]
MLAVATRTRTYPVLWPERGAPERRSRATRRRRLTPLTRALVAAALVVASAIAYVGQSASAARTGYAILALRTDVERLQAEHARLLVVATGLKSPARIERIARLELGMVYPAPTQVQALALPAPAVAAPVAPPPSAWQRMADLLFGREAAAGETH